jgi:hypothetical protein
MYGQISLKVRVKGSCERLKTRVDRRTTSKVGPEPTPEGGNCQAVYLACKSSSADYLQRPRWIVSAETQATMGYGSQDPLR